MSADFVRFAEAGERCELLSPVRMPQASAFLWNPGMLLQVNCQGYATAQHMQPEPAKYSRAPVLEQKTFIQPEQPYFANHPGRFVYVKDEDSGHLVSAPFAPVMVMPDDFVFSAGQSDIHWQVRFGDIVVKLSVFIPADDNLEHWTIAIENEGDRPRRLSVYPVFTIGYMSWMNQSARYDESLGGIVASSITPYQQLQDYPSVKMLKDKTFLLHDSPPAAWDASVAAFEGVGSAGNPESIRAGMLGCSDAIYETPIAALQYQWQVEPGDARQLRFLFGPAREEQEIAGLRQKYFDNRETKNAGGYVQPPSSPGDSPIRVETPDPHFDSFINRWLPRQVHYHGTLNRLTTDPQTRNYLQDNMGMSYLDAGVARHAFLRAMSQQHDDGAMPEGILLNGGTALKYINEVPHTDHCVWLPVCLEAYLDETADFALLDEVLPSATPGPSRTVFDGLQSAADWLLGNRDARGLSLIAQGDWCDPMNMAGHNGKGVSGWLTIATVHALRCLSRIAAAAGRTDIAELRNADADRVAAAAKAHLWDGGWYARGISDDGARFGVSVETEGRIYLNPQSWAILAGIATPEQLASLLGNVREQLETPWGAALLAPAYTSMREHIGRVTQKFPGTAENGAIYNHAAAFYVASLYECGRYDHAFEQLRLAIPGPDATDYERRGQLPAFIPNYYRGAVQQFPRTAGRSSQLFNTGAASWFLRIVIERTFGLRGCPEGLWIRPELPSAWPGCRVVRQFRGAEFLVRMTRDSSARHTSVCCDGRELAEPLVRDVEPGRRYTVEVTLPGS